MGSSISKTTPLYTGDELVSLTKRKFKKSAKYITGQQINNLTDEQFIELADRVKYFNDYQLKSIESIDRFLFIAPKYKVCLLSNEQINDLSDRHIKRMSKPYTNVLLGNLAEELKKNWRCNTGYYFTIEQFNSIDPSEINRFIPLFENALNRLRDIITDEQLEHLSVSKFKDFSTRIRYDDSIFKSLNTSEFKPKKLQLYMLLGIYNPTWLLKVMCKVEEKGKFSSEKQFLKEILSEGTLRKGVYYQLTYRHRRYFTGEDHNSNCKDILGKNFNDIWSDFLIETRHMGLWSLEYMNLEEDMNLEEEMMKKEIDDMLSEMTPRLGKMYKKILQKDQEVQKKMLIHKILKKDREQIEMNWSRIHRQHEKKNYERNQPQKIYIRQPAPPQPTWTQILFLERNLKL